MELCTISVDGVAGYYKDGEHDAVVLSATIMQY